MYLHLAMACGTMCIDLNMYLYLAMACRTMCIDFSKKKKVWYSTPFVYSLLVYSFHSTYTTGTGGYYKMTYLASDWDEQLRRAYDDERELTMMVRRQEERRVKVPGIHGIADGKYRPSGISGPGETWRLIIMFLS
jgi:hypothetical protein